MKKMTKDDNGQVFTIEGVVSAVILVAVLAYIMTSITLVSPQTEKTTMIKLDIKAQDVLNVMANEDQPGNHSSALKMGVAGWNGTEPAGGAIVDATELTAREINDTIDLVLPGNMFYNLDITYYNDTLGAYENKVIIYEGEPGSIVGTAKKLVVLNKNDSTNQSDYWKKMTMPKTTEVKLIIWTI